MQQAPERVDRLQVLKEVNRIFARYGLPLWDIKRLGMQSKGEFEIVGVESVYNELWRSFVYVLFKTIKPDGSQGTYAMEFNAPAAIVILVVNGKMVLVRQHRPTLGKWTMEIPRGWIEESAVGDPAAEVRSILNREVGQEWVATFSSFAPVLLGQPAEDSGRKAGNGCRVYLLETTTAVAPPKRCGVHRPRLVEPNELDRLRELDDQHSFSALYLWQRYQRQSAARLEAEVTHSS